MVQPLAAATAEEVPASSAKRAHPLLWVPSLYFAMGLPNSTGSASSRNNERDRRLTERES